jgi:hypothetical protein
MIRRMRLIMSVEAMALPFQSDGLQFRPECCLAPVIAILGWIWPWPGRHLFPGSPVLLWLQPRQQGRAPSGLSRTGLPAVFRKGLSVEESAALTRARIRWREGPPGEDRHGLPKVGRVRLGITFLPFLPAVYVSFRNGTGHCRVASRSEGVAPFFRR